MSDRTVHARYPGMEIVRYDRAGKWYLEPTNPSLPRQKVKVKEAAQSAVWGMDNAGGIWFNGTQGSTVFDSLVRAEIARLK